MTYNKTNQRSLWMTTTALGLVAIAWGGPIAAQTADDSPIKELEAVTVTATKTERSALDVPASVSVIGTDQLQRDQVRDLGDVLKNIPGAEMSGGPRSLGEQPNLRGLGASRMVIGIDGARQNFESGHRGRIFMDPDLLKQVEVLRGPSSVLHGSGALGGVLAMTTKDAADLLRPGENLGAIVRGGYQTGNVDRMVSGAVFGRADNFDAVVNGVKRNSKNVELGTGVNLQDSARDSDNGFAKFGVTVGDFHTFGFSAMKFEEQDKVPSNPSSAPSSSNPVLDRQTDQENYTFRYSYNDPSNDLIKINTLVYDNTTNITEDRLPQFGTARHDTTQFDTSGIDMRNTSTFGRGEKIEQAVTIGIDWYKDEQEGKRNFQPRTSFSDAEAQLYGLYIQDEIKLFDDWTLTPALRRDAWNTNPSMNNKTEQSESRISPKVTLMWQAQPWLSLYTSYAEAFRAPTMIELYSTHPGFTTLDASNLRPEVMTNYEGGFRLKFDNVIAKEDALRVKFSYYDASVEDYIDSEFNTTALTARNFNVPKAHLNGFESEIGYDAGTVFASLGASAVRGDDETNNRPLTTIPQDKGVLGIGGRYQPYDLTFGWRGSLLLEQDRIPVTTASGTSVPPTGGSFVQDIYATWLPQNGYLAGTRIDFGIDNLFDVAYRRHLSKFEEEGINFKLTASRQF